MTRGKVWVYLFSHLVKIGVGSVVHHRIGKHQIDIPLVFEGVGYLAFSYSRFDRLQVYGSSDDLIIIRGVRSLHWSMEDAPVSKLAYLVMEKNDDVLEYSGSCLRGGAAPLLGWR